MIENYFLCVNLWNYISKAYWEIKDANKLAFIINDEKGSFLFQSYTKFIFDFFSNNNFYTLVNQSKKIDLANNSSLTQIKEIISMIKFVNDAIENLLKLFTLVFNDSLNDLDENLIVVESESENFQNLNIKDKIRILRSLAFIHIFDYKQNSKKYLFQNYFAGGFLEYDFQSKDIPRERIILIDKETLEEITIYFDYYSLIDYLIYRICILMKIYFLLKSN